MSDDPNAAGNLKLRGASATKPPLGIVPMHPLVGVARVLEDSGIKYAPFNYMTQPTIDALEAYDSGELRHRLASTLLGGQVTPESYAALDPDSGIPHIYHRIAGLLILASLMIRDGLLSADPGMGKRKRAAFEGTQRPRPTVGDNYPLGEPGGWYTCKEHGSDKCLHAPEPEKLKLDTSDPHTAAVFETCKQAAAEVASWPAWKRGEYSEPKTTDYCARCGESPESGSHLPHGHEYVDPRPDLRGLAERIATRELPARDDAPTSTPALPERDDPDAARRAAGDAHVEQLKREQATLAEQKRKWEQRCLLCNGTGKIENDPEERNMRCYRCNGTGQRTGAEGVRW